MSSDEARVTGDRDLFLDLWVYLLAVEAVELDILDINFYYFPDSDSASISSNASSTIEKKSRAGGAVAKPKLKVFISNE